MSCLVLLCKKPFSVLTPSLALSGFTVGGVHQFGLAKRRGQVAGTGCRLCPLEPGVHPSPRERLSNRLPVFWTPGVTFKITLYEGKHFTGRKLEVFGDCDNFQDRGFMNRVNSVRVESGAWVCFDHPDFRGQQFILEHGDYPDFYRWNGHNDHMGSCRPVRMSRGWSKNCVNAIKAYGDGAWVLYEEPNYRGRMYLVERGDFRSFSDWEAPSARVQSLRRVANF
ncbi:gamma-crystallin N isoform X3 [Bubalus kerabau]|uniref:gamma-crystallin N isoform X3 n=1 Tax=Bubalus carabanensis TaxID=3119969 RepID=UPI00244E8BB8|nr:gamma-crystallin N isoform X3 [Bubalus carabanensis]